MKIAIIGSRGIPANYGGFETFAEELSLSLKNKYNDLDITVVCDHETKKINNAQDEFKNIKLIYSKYTKKDNPLRFYYESMMMSRNSDVTLACGNGIGLFAPLNKLFNSKLIINLFSFRLIVTGSVFIQIIHVRSFPVLFLFSY